MSDAFDVDAFLAGIYIIESDAVPPGAALMLGAGTRRPGEWGRDAPVVPLSNGYGWDLQASTMVTGLGVERREG